MPATPKLSLGSTACFGETPCTVRSRELALFHVTPEVAGSLSPVSTVLFAQTPFTVRAASIL